MTKTAREIINQAMKLAQCQNSKAFDFSLLVSLLNSAYTKVYNDLSGYTNAFMKYFTFTGDEVRLPSDCFKVLMVYKGKKENPFIISQSSLNNYIPNTYVIENDILRIVGKKDSNEVTVKYSAVPLTLTAPDDPEIIDVDYDEVQYLSDYGFHYKKNDKTYFYSFENKESTEVTKAPTSSNKFNNFAFSWRTVGNIDQVVWNAKDVTNMFIAYDEQTGKELRIKKMVHDNTHILIQYDNNDLYLMTGDWKKVMVNPDLYKGRYFKVDDIYAICGDDSTGKGALVSKDGLLLYIDFVPDTVLNYTNNIFFDIIEDMIAIQLQSLCSMNNDALQTKLTNDEQSFYESLQRSQQGIRIKNESNMRFGSGLQW